MAHIFFGVGPPPPPYLHTSPSLLAAAAACFPFSNFKIDELLPKLATKKLELDDGIIVEIIESEIHADDDLQLFKSIALDSYRERKKGESAAALKALIEARASDPYEFFILNKDLFERAITAGMTNEHQDLLARTKTIEKFTLDRLPAKDPATGQTKSISTAVIKALEKGTLYLEGVDDHLCTRLRNEGLTPIKLIKLRYRHKMAKESLTRKFTALGKELFPIQARESEQADDPRPFAQANENRRQGLGCRPRLERCLRSYQRRERGTRMRQLTRAFS